jgi:hypothetical protein
MWYDQRVFLFGVEHADAFVAKRHPAGIAHLAAAFRVKRGAVQHDLVLRLLF